MTNSKRKGKTGELEAARILRLLLGIEVRRSQQYNGAAGTADLAGLPFHAEVKRSETLRLYDWLEQARTDAAEAGAIPVVIHRKNFTGWLLSTDLDNLVPLARAVVALVGMEEQ